MDKRFGARKTGESEVIWHLWVHFQWSVLKEALITMSDQIIVILENISYHIAMKKVSVCLRIVQWILEGSRNAWFLLGGQYGMIDLRDSICTRILADIHQGRD